MDVICFIMPQRKIACFMSTAALFEAVLHNILFLEVNADVESFFNFVF